MRFDLITIFPDFFAGPLEHGIVRRAREAKITDVRVQDLRAFTKDRHRTVDDRPFGGGEGMVLKPEPLFEAVESLLGAGVGGSDGRIAISPETAIVLMSASGKLFKQETARRLAKRERIILICGRYEGVDERVAEHLATEEISIGDYVLSGGELPAALVVDAVTRLLPGALGNEASAQNESFAGDGDRHGRETEDFRGASFTADISPLPKVPEGGEWNRGILDYPHYTRPAEYRGWGVPQILLNGNHEEIRRWRREKAIEKTKRNRADLLNGVFLKEKGHPQREP